MFLVTLEVVMEQFSKIHFIRITRFSLQCSIGKVMLPYYILILLRKMYHMHTASPLYVNFILMVPKTKI